MFRSRLKLSFGISSLLCAQFINKIVDNFCRDVRHGNQVGIRALQGDLPFLQHRLVDARENNGDRVSVPPRIYILAGKLADGIVGNIEAILHHCSEAVLANGLNEMMQEYGRYAIARSQDGRVFRADILDVLRDAINKRPPCQHNAARHGHTGEFMAADGNRIYAGPKIKGLRFINEGQDHA